MLGPRWLYDEAPLRYGAGFSIQCPAHPHDAGDRAELWFIHPMDGEGPVSGLERPPERFYGYEGHSFDDLTVWQELPYPEEAVRTPHWWGYIANGVLYSCARWSSI